ncbi:hypothetical protein NIES4106_27440 [Fischerella sp. NIES-4106]|nr:hypothetical protein NIES4106_27440 [Fischerella sp. NIES-4106]
MQPKKLGITQLSLSLFLLKQKNTQGTFHNSPSIPERVRCGGSPRCSTSRPITDLEYQVQSGSPGGLR